MALPISPFLRLDASLVFVQTGYSSAGLYTVRLFSFKMIHVAPRSNADWQSFHEKWSDWDELHGAEARYAGTANARGKQDTRDLQMMLSLSLAPVARYKERYRELRSFTARLNLLRMMFHVPEGFMEDIDCDRGLDKIAGNVSAC
jgi:hypothetical protein